MSLQDPISDMLIRICNGQRIGRSFVVMPASKMKIGIAHTLKEEGYILDYELAENAKETKINPILKIFLKYYEGKGVIRHAKRVSRPSLRVYQGYREFKRILNGLGIAIISTSQGIMSDRIARREKKGGEVICFIY